METLYFGVPVLLLSRTDEERALAKRVVKVDCGVIAASDPRTIGKQVTQMIDQEASNIWHMAKAVEKLLWFEEQQGGSKNSLAEMIKYVAKFGTRHLQAREEVGGGYRANFDLDFKAGFLVLGYLLVSLLETLVGFACKKRP